MDQKFSRRTALSLGGAGATIAATGALAQTFGNPDRPPQGAINATPEAQSIPGPKNKPLSNLFPDAESPPATDVGGVPRFWSSFELSNRRIQAGGWARQVTVADFPVSTEVSGVNMRLAAGGIRELHWHNAAEWAIMTYGHCRVTVLDQDGKLWIGDVEEGDLWFFPAGFPHSLQGLGPDGCEFVIVFDSGEASEFDTTLVTDWFAHTPPEVLAQNFNLAPEAFKNVPLNDLWIFQGKIAGSVGLDQSEDNPFLFRLSRSRPHIENAAGVIHLADSTNFKMSTTIAAALERLKPGAMRELHWHPHADEWQYWIKGHGRVGIFGAGPKASTMDFSPGDLAVVKRNYGHYVLNTGDEDVIFLAVFRAPRYMEVSLAEWIAHLPHDLVTQHLNIPEADLKKIAMQRQGIVPKRQK